MVVEKICKDTYGKRAQCRDGFLRIFSSVLKVGVNEVYHDLTKISLTFFNSFNRSHPFLDMSFVLEENVMPILVILANIGTKHTQHTDRYSCLQI